MLCAACVCVYIFSPVFFLFFLLSRSDGLNVNRRECRRKIIMIRLRHCLRTVYYFVKCTSEQKNWNGEKRESERERERYGQTDDVVIHYATMTG